MCSQTTPTQATPTLPDVCLCGEGRTQEAVVRQWVEFYLVRVKMETPWDVLSKDCLHAVLEVRVQLLQWTPSNVAILRVVSS